MQRIGFVLNIIAKFFKNILFNFRSKWNVMLSTLLPIIIYGLLILFSGRDNFQIRIMDAYVISLSLLFAPVLELFYRFFNETVSELSVRKFRAFIKTEKLITSSILIFIIIMLMAFDDSRGLFDYSLGLFDTTVNIFALVIIVLSLYLIDLYDDVGVQSAIYNASKTEIYEIERKESE